MKRFWVILVLVVFVAAGCAKKETVQPEAQPSQKQAETTTGAEKVTEKKGAGEGTITSKDVEGTVAGKEGIIQDVHFDFDKYDIRDSDKPTLKAASDYMTANSDAKLSVEGHCDERGTNEYNLALGDRRAKAVKDYLVSLGVSSGRVDTISFGEEKPLCKEQTEDCWAKNRRGHFVVLGKAGK